MSDPRRDAPPELELEHVGGRGRASSWKTAAVVVVALLVGIVGFALYGKSQTPQPPPVAVRPSIPAATAEVTPEPPPPVLGNPARPRPSLPPQGEPPPQTAISELRFGADAYAVIAQIDGRLYMDVLQESERNRFSGSFRVPFPSDPTRVYEIELAQIWTRDHSRRSYVVIGTWKTRLGGLREGTTITASLIEDVVRAHPGKVRAPRAIKQGYAVHIAAESRYNFGVINIDVLFGEIEAAGPSVVYRDWPLRKDKYDLAILYRSFVDAQR